MTAPARPDEPFWADIARRALDVTRDTVFCPGWQPWVRWLVLIVTVLLVLGGLARMLGLTWS